MTKERTGTETSQYSGSFMSYSKHRIFYNEKNAL